MLCVVVLYKREITMLDGTCYFFQVKTRDFYPEKTTQSQRITESVLKISSTIIHLNFSLLVLVQIHALKRLQVYLSKKALTVHISLSSVRN